MWKNRSVKSYRQVHGNLYVGGHESSKRHGDKFDSVISMASPSKNTDYEYIIDDGSHKYEKFSNAVDKTIEELDKDKKVLVHCKAGLSRSVSVCTATQVCYFSNIGYIEAIQNARSGFRLPENELMFSAENYIIENNCRQVSKKQSKNNDTEKILSNIIQDIDSFDDDKLSKKDIKLIIGKNLENTGIDRQER